MKRTVTLILAMLFSLCLLLPAAASQDPSAEAASTQLYAVNGHWYTQAQYQNLFGGAGGQARQAVDADADWLLAGTDLITLSDSRNDPVYDSDLDHLKVDYAVIDGSLLSGNTWDGNEATYDLSEIVTNNEGATISQNADGVTIDFDDFGVLGGSVTAVLAANPADYRGGTQPSDWVTVTGDLVSLDESDGFNNNDFTGIGVGVVAAQSALIDIKDTSISTSGFGRDCLIVDDCATVIIENSTLSADGYDPLDKSLIYDGFSNNADFACMLAAPWILGMNGGSRVVNMMGNGASVVAYNSTLEGTGWAILSVDFYTGRTDQTNPGRGYGLGLVTIDSVLRMRDDSEGGNYSGADIFGYDRNYGTGYGNYSGGAKFYGTTFDNMTYSCIVAGGNKYFGRSDGTFDYSVGGREFSFEGAGQPCTIDTVIGIMTREPRSSTVTFAEGTVVKSQEMTALVRGGPARLNFYDAVLEPQNGVLVALLDDEENALTGGRNGEAGPNTFCLGAVIDPGWACDNGNVTASDGNAYVSNIYMAGEYEGDIYNASGYYGQTAVDQVIRIGCDEGAAAYTGDVNLACYMQGMAYSARAVEAIERYNANGGTLTYALIDADGNVTEDPENAVYIQFVEYGQTEYWVFGHVVYKDFVNGFANIEIDVADGSEWRVANASTISKLVIEPGAAVFGELTENEDGTITITASDNVLPAGEYGFYEVEEAVSSGSGEASGGASGEAS